MTSFNREKYISEAIESVLASTFKDFELIIVDDCSIDSTIDIARSYAKKDTRIKVFQNPVNLGDYPNRNKAASYSKGKYIKYVDADDFIYPNGIEIIVNQMEKFPEASVGLFSLQQNILSPFPLLLNPKEVYQYNFFGQGLFHKAPLSAIFRRSDFIEIGGFRNIRHSGDFELWHRIAQRYCFLLIQDHIVWSREHDDQESKKHDLIIELNYTRIEKEYILDENSPLSIDQRKLIFLKKRKMYFKQSIMYTLNFKVQNSLLSFRRLMIYLRWKR